MRRRTVDALIEMTGNLLKDWRLGNWILNEPAHSLEHFSLFSPRAFFVFQFRAAAKSSIPISGLPFSWNPNAHALVSLSLSHSLICHVEKRFTLLFYCAPDFENVNPDLERVSLALSLSLSLDTECLVFRMICLIPLKRETSLLWVYFQSSFSIYLSSILSVHLSFVACSR